jgi:cytochrome c biogenesis protein CcmG, thiol:disulfide interchange protein DsbE
VNVRSRTPLVLAIVIVVIGVVALIAVLATRDGGDDDDTASTVPPAAGGSVDDSASEGTTGPPPASAGVSVEGSVLPPGQGEDDPAIGTPAPTLRGRDYEGNEVTIAPGTDGPMMVVFLAHWCPHCNAEIPVLLEWEESGEMPDELQIFGVSTAATADRPNYPPDQWLQEKGWAWPVLADDDQLTAANAYGVTGFPYFVIVDADGNVVVRNSGEIPLEDLDAMVDEAIA